MLVGCLLAACTAGLTRSGVSEPPQPAASGATSVPAAPSETSPGRGATGAVVPRSSTTGTATPLAAAVALDGPAESIAGIDTAATVIERPLRAASTGAVVVTRAAPPAIGPLRSASGADATLARMWRADLVATVATGAVVATQWEVGLAVLEEGTGSQVVRRDPARRAPHNAYAVARAARSAAARAVPSPPADRSTPWATGVPPVVGGRAIDRVDVDATASTRVSWTWDARSGRWNRGVDGDRQLAAGGLPIAVGTVVVAETAPRRPHQLRGAGVAVVLRAGRQYAARWQRDDLSHPLRVEQLDGTPFPVEGTVWLHLCAAPCARQIAPSTRRPYGAPR